MRALLGRLANLDPAASNDLIVIEYFDRIVAANMPLDGLVKEAAVLARATVGYESGARHYRFLPSGDASAGSRPPNAINASTSAGAEVWLAPSSAASPSAQMVLERLVLAIELTENRRSRERELPAVEILLAPPQPDELPGTRAGAMGRLRLEDGGHFRAIALPLSTTPPVGCPHAVIETTRGPIRGAIVRQGYRSKGVVGIGSRTSGRLLYKSWQHALIALRLTEPEHPLSADDFGPVLLQALEGLEEPTETAIEEVSRINRARAGHWSIPELRALADGRSLRVIAASAGLHHSTVHARLSTLPGLLGYDPQTPLGRIRLATSLLLWRLQEPTPYDRPC